jgi:hypothetical protein
VQTAGAPVKPLSSSRAAPRSILPADRFITETRDVIAERPAEPRPTGKLSYLEKKLAQYK